MILNYMENIVILYYIKLHKNEKSISPYYSFAVDIRCVQPEHSIRRCCVFKERFYPYVAKENGFESEIDLLLAVQLEWAEPVLGMHAIAGYRFIPQFFMGGGFGVEIYTDGNMLPLFLNIRTDFVKARVTPFFSANVGYAFGWINGEDGSDWGGIFLEPGIGFRFNIAEHFGLNISSSFKFQKAYFNNHYWDYSYPGNSHYERIPETYRLFIFKVGFSF